MHLHFTLHLTRKHHFNCFKQLQLLLPNRFSQEEKMLTFYWCCLTTTKVSELLSKLFKLFCHARNGKLAIWLQIPSQKVGFKSQKCAHSSRSSLITCHDWTIRQTPMISDHQQWPINIHCQLRVWWLDIFYRQENHRSHPCSAGQPFPSPDRQGCVQLSITLIPAPLLRFQSGRGQWW